MFDSAVYASANAAFDGSRAQSVKTSHLAAEGDLLKQVSQLSSPSASAISSEYLTVKVVNSSRRDA
jgi:hypothetical protein